MTVSVKLNTPLHPAELRVLVLFAEGLTINEVAACLRRSRYTVNDHEKSIFQKLGVHTRIQAIAIALYRGLIPWPSFTEDSTAEASPGACMLLVPLDEPTAQRIGVRPNVRRIHAQEG
jgi:DNA-binding CsgD family transcriptional regulator